MTTTLQPETIALAMPDAPGWWAGIQDGRKFTAEFTKFEIVGDKVYIVWGDDAYTMGYFLDEFKDIYSGTAWYRLTMPWDEQPAPEPLVMPPDVREAIRDAIVQRKFDIYDVCGVDTDRAEQLCVRYDKAFEWLAQRRPAAGGE